MVMVSVSVINVNVMLSRMATIRKRIIVKVKFLHKGYLIFYYEF